MKKIERVCLKLSNETYNKINRCEDLKEVITGTLSNGDDYEVVIFSDNTIDYYEIKINTEHLSILKKGDFNSLNFNVIKLVEYNDNQVLFVFQFEENKLPLSTKLSVSKLKTDMILNDKLDLNYLKAIAINHSFEIEEELGEVLFLYLYLKTLNVSYYNGELRDEDFQITEVEEYMKEKFDYYGHNYETIKKYYKSFSNKYLKKMIQLSMPMLYLNEVEEVEKEELKIIYNGFQEIEIKKKY